MYDYGMTPEEAHDNYIKARAYTEGYEAAKKEFARPHGEWVRNDNGTFSCSKCKSWIPKEQHYYARYCLFCGRLMR